MNFTLEQAFVTGGRLGKLTHSVYGQTLLMETPMCTLYTKGGSAPYLGLNMLEKIKCIPEIATMSINSYIDHIDSIKESGKGIAGFTSMQKRLIFSTLHDASLLVPSGKNEKSGVAVWGKGGKMMLNPKEYMKMQESLKPDWIMALSDGDTDKESTEKRAGKAVDRTLDFLDDIVAIKEKSEVLKTSSLIGVIVGGFSERHRERSAKETTVRPVNGFLFEGFQKGNSDENIFDNDSFQQILTQTMTHIPENKPRIMETPWSPLQVIKAFKLGIDVFSSAYPHTLAEKGIAMTEDYTLPPSETTKLENGESDTGYIGPTININEKRFFDDFGPIHKGCQCYACCNFTRSYIHHLLNTSELLAHVLLTIHNFEQYFHFFDCLRNALRNGRVEELEKSLSQQQQEKCGS